MNGAIQIEAGPETLRAIAALTEQLAALNMFFKKQTEPQNIQPDEDDWLTMKEFTERYKLSPGTVYSQVEKGHVERLYLGAKSPRYRLRKISLAR